MNADHDTLIWIMVAGFGIAIYELLQIKNASEQAAKSAGSIGQTADTVNSTLNSLGLGNG